MDESFDSWLEEECKAQGYPIDEVRVPLKKACDEAFTEARATVEVYLSLPIFS